MTVIGQLQAQDSVKTESGVTVPPAKQTSAGLYLTSKEAYAKWQADPDNVTIIDVRTPEEYAFVGHAPMAWNIPLLLVALDRSPEGGKLALNKNAEFTEEVKGNFQPTDTLLIMCRSGARSTAAVNLLAAEGYEKLYNVIDGFEGDSIKDPDSVFDGWRLKNGWRNAGIPWTYKLNPEIVRIPKRP
jgi:rhodanese-related sulfurtransferase